MGWKPAYVGLGSNLAEPRKQVLRAFDELAKLPRTLLLARSALYGSRPFGPIAQPDFVNAAAGLLTQLSPHELLRALRELEISLGRAPPRERWGPRVIDLDLLVYGSERIADDTLTLPHPGIAERSFVLRPLADIAPALEVPGAGVVNELLARVAQPEPWVIANGA
jgi:2-amino-4-hydroxy-6-hydroxymethyldihydropteridine diphosphokinase